jgi:hypothetical protein
VVSVHRTSRAGVPACSAAVTVWDIAKWPVLLLIIGLIL